MKYVKTFEQFIADKNQVEVNEKSIKFHGKTVNDVLNIIKPVKDGNIEFFANGKHYGLGDPDEMKNDPHETTIFGIDQDGGEHEIKVSDIESFEVFENILTEKEFSEEERKELAKKGWAEDDGSYPIESKEDLHNAIQSVGRSKDIEKTKVHIKKNAKRLGQESMIPEDWK